jgi:hypothetical protein
VRTASQFKRSLTGGIGGDSRLDRMTADAFITRARAAACRPAIAALLIAALTACGGSGSTVEDEIRAWIDRGHEAAENKDRSDLVEMISPAYSDARGNSRDDIENLFRFYFLRSNRVALLVDVDQIEVFDDTAAEVELTVGMGATTDSALGFNADAYRFALELENDGGEWLLVSGRWSEIGRELR